MRSARRRCSLLRRMQASSPASSCSWMAASRRCSPSGEMAAAAEFSIRTYVPSAPCPSSSQSPISDARNSEQFASVAADERKRCKSASPPEFPPHVLSACAFPQERRQALGDPAAPAILRRRCYPIWRQVQPLTLVSADTSLDPYSADG